MTRIYFVRHAQPDPSCGYNPDFPLTELGKNDALTAADVLKDKDISAVYSSSYLRAVQTVTPFAEEAGLEIIKEYSLRERTGGNWQSSFENYAEYINAQIEDISCKVEGGESLEEVQERCMETIEQIIAENDGKAVVVGIHGMALATILMHYFPGFGTKDFYQIVDLMPLILKLDIEDGKCESYGIELAIKRIYPNGYLKLSDTLKGK